MQIGEEPDRFEGDISDQFALIHWILGNRPLSKEIQRAAKVGYLKGTEGLEFRLLEIPKAPEVNPKSATPPIALTS